MNIIIGLAIALGALLGGFAYMGCNLWILAEPSEYIVLLGAAFGIFIFANSIEVIKDTGLAIYEAFMNKAPTKKHYVELLGLLYALLSEMRLKPKSEVEKHIDDPYNSEIFSRYPSIFKVPALLNFISDYCRLILIGQARSFEIEALMDEEIETLTYDRMLSYNAIKVMADSLPALGIVAAVLGIIRALCHINVRPEILGHYIGSALVGTFAGVFFAYGVFGPLAVQIKSVRHKQTRLFIVVKQTLLAYMNGSIPQVCLEYGRKTISDSYRPSIDMVEEQAIGGQRG